MVRREEKDDHVLRALARIKTTLYREFLALDHPNTRNNINGGVGCAA